MLGEQEARVSSSFKAVHEEKNYYDVLGIPRSASPKRIKKAYHELARKYHPDAIGKQLPAGESEVECREHFKEATTAYRILINEESRQEYDDTLGIGEVSDWLKNTPEFGDRVRAGFGGGSKNEAIGRFGEILDFEEDSVDSVGDEEDDTISESLVIYIRHTHRMKLLKRLVLVLALGMTAVLTLMYFRVI